VDTSFGEEADWLCEFLRKSGAVHSISEIVDSPEPHNCNMALLLIGNIASDAVDSKADETKAILKQTGAFGRLLPHLWTEDWMTLVYALGAVQNTCTELEYVELMQEFGCVPRLQDLLRLGDPQLKQYAKGCLANMRQTILAEATLRQLQNQKYSGAAKLIQKKARRRIARKKAAEMQLLKGLTGAVPENLEDTAQHQMLKRLEEMKLNSKRHSRNDTPGTPPTSSKEGSPLGPGPGA